MFSLYNNTKIKLVTVIANFIAKTLENLMQEALKKEDFNRFETLFEQAAMLNAYVSVFYNINLD